MASDTPVRNASVQQLQMQDSQTRRVQNLKDFRLPPNFRGRSALMVQLWWLVQATLFRGSPQVCYGFRRWLLRRFGAHIGKGVIVRPSATLTYPWRIRIGDHSWIGDDVVIYSFAEITIGKMSSSRRRIICVPELTITVAKIFPSRRCRL